MDGYKAGDKAIQKVTFAVTEMATVTFAQRKTTIGADKKNWTLNFKGVKNPNIKFANVDREVVQVPFVTQSAKITYVGDQITDVVFVWPTDAPKKETKTEMVTVSKVAGTPGAQKIVFQAADKTDFPEYTYNGDVKAETGMDARITYDLY
jgi:hypothetical protein